MKKDEINNFNNEVKYENTKDEAKKAQEDKSNEKDNNQIKENKDSQTKGKENMEENIKKDNSSRINENKKAKRGKKRPALVLLFIALASIVGYVIFRGQYLELQEIGEKYTSVFWQNVTYNLVTFAINFVVIYIVIYFTNRGIKKELRPFFEAEHKEVPKLLNKSLALVVGVIGSALTTAMFTNKAMLSLNNGQFGIQDPIFGLDIGYFIFQKPFIETIISYLMELTIGALLYSVIYYIVTFNVCFDGIDRKTLKNSKLLNKEFKYLKILVVFLAIFIIFKIQGLGTESGITLQDEDSTQITGAGLTSVIVKLWGYVLLAILIVVSVFKAINAFQAGNTKKVVTSLIAVPAYLLILLIVMVIFQLVFVKPNELDREKKYIEANIKNTRDAYNINIQENELDGTKSADIDTVYDNKQTVDNTVVVSQNITLDTLKDKQSSSKYYNYKTTQIGKYKIANKEQYVYISPRQISNPNVTYNNKTYEYTHGYGSVITSATTTDNTGNIKYIQKSFDGSDNQINVTQPRTYFGIDSNTPIVTNSKTKSEFDYPKTDTENAENTYDGTAGLKLGFFDRIILGIKEKNLKLAFSSDVTDNSKILINRNILKRVQAVFPNIIYDESPYQVITNEGKIVWVIDGYTIASDYPYSQETVIERNGTRQRINYIRNSVKVTVDSYDGTVKFYITDTTDPIIMSYKKIYPDLFAEKDETIPNDIATHFVYPKYLYNIQADMLKRYHNVKTDVLYRSSDVWDRATHTTSKSLKAKGTAIDPYYTGVKTVDSEETQLGLVLPYTLYEKQSLISYLVGTCDVSGNSKLTLYKYSADSNVVGPMQLDTQIEQDSEISGTIQNLNVTGTKLIRDMIMVPIDNTILYVEPIYQVMINESEVPVLKKVIVAVGNKVAIGDNLTEALKNLTSQDAINIEISNTDNINSVIDEIIKAKKNVKNSTTNNNWEQMGKDMNTLQSLIDRLEVLRQDQIDEEKKEKANKIDNSINSISEKNEISNSLVNTLTK